MDPVTLSITIARPREEVYDYLADIANRPQYLDHYLADFRLTREDSVGAGAGARFRIKAPLRRYTWADVTIAEAQRPWRIAEAGRGGKFNRIKMMVVYTLTEAAEGMTHVELVTETEPEEGADRVMDVGARRWYKRQAAKGLRRLQAILEDAEGAKPGPRATLAGG